MKTAIYINISNKPGGIEKRFYNLFRYLNKQNSNIFLIVPSNHEIIEVNDIKKCKNVYSLCIDKNKYTRIFYYTKVIVKLRKLLNINKFSHLHFAMNPNPITLLYSIFYFVLPKYSCSIVNSTKKTRKDFTYFEYFCFKYTIIHAKKVDFLSTTIYNDITKTFKIKNTKNLCVSPCSFTDHTKANICMQKDIDIAVISRFSDGKGFDLLGNSLKILNDQYSRRLNIHICGYGPLENEITDYKNKYRNHNIRIYSTQNPFIVLSRSKIFLSLQEYDNYPSQSLLEAMSCECAIIATDVGETRNLLNSKCSILIRPNKNELVNAIIKIHSDDNKRKELGINARKVVISEHTISNYANYFLSSILTA